MIESCFSAQVIAAKIAVNTGGKVEVIPATNQVVSALSGPIPQGNPQLGQAQVSPLPPQPLSTFSVSGQTPHNQIVQPPMASFATAMQGHNQIPAAQQPVSFAGTIMAAAIGGGRCAIQTATVPGEILQSSVGSMGPAVPLPQPALVYTVTRTTDNMPLASTIVPATGHEVTLMADRSCNPVSSMPGPMLVPPRGAQQGFNNTASQAMVQPQSHQNNGKVCRCVEFRSRFRQDSCYAANIAFRCVRCFIQLRMSFSFSVFLLSTCKIVASALLFRQIIFYY